MKKERHFSHWSYIVIEFVLDKCHEVLLQAFMSSKCPEEEIRSEHDEQKTDWFPSSSVRGMMRIGWTPTR